MAEVQADAELLEEPASLGLPQTAVCAPLPQEPALVLVYVCGWWGECAFVGVSAWGAGSVCEGECACGGSVLVRTR